MSIKPIKPSVFEVVSCDTGLGLDQNLHLIVSKVQF